MQVELHKVEKVHKSVLRQLMELYCYDFSEFLLTDVNEHGTYEYPYLDEYWTDPNRYPFFIKANGKLAGFILINKHFKIINNPKGHVVAEFFVMRKYRRQGIGSNAAKVVFKLFPGSWEVSQIKINQPALLFWEKVIDEYTNGDYSVEHIEKDGIKKQVLFFTD